MSHRAGHRRCERRPRMEKRVGWRYRRTLGKRASPKLERTYIERAYRHHLNQSLRQWQDHDPQWNRAQRHRLFW